MNRVQTILPEVLLESTCDDREAALELLDLFFELSMQEMERLTLAANEGHAAVVLAAAHKMVSSALACGLVGLADELRNLELCCRQGVPSDVDERVRSVELRFSEAREFFKTIWKID